MLFVAFDKSGSTRVVGEEGRKRVGLGALRFVFRQKGICKSSLSSASYPLR